MGTANLFRPWTTEDEIGSIRSIYGKYLHAGNKEDGVMFLRLYRMALSFRHWPAPDRNGLGVDVFVLRMELMRMIGEPSPMEMVKGMEDYERVVVALADKRFKRGDLRVISHVPLTTGPWDV